MSGVVSLDRHPPFRGAAIAGPLALWAHVILGCVTDRYCPLSVFPTAAVERITTTLFVSPSSGCQIRQMLGLAISQAMLDHADGSWYSAKSMMQPVPEALDAQTWNN